jgi:3-oxoacyl-[acyl-carrier-protein] synthase-3
MALLPAGFRILSSGTAFPAGSMTNARLSSELGVTPDWIEQRCGVLSRQVAAEGETTSSLAVEAARQALSATEARPDLLICCTYTPDNLCIPQAPAIASELGLTAGAFDLNAACSGGLIGLLTAIGYLTTGLARRILLVASDTTTRFLAADDINTRILFGDGAAALLLEAVPREEQGNGHRLLASLTGSDGSGAGFFQAPLFQGGDPVIKMDGKSLFKFAVNRGAAAMAELLESARLAANEIHHVVLHQANIRILKAIQESSGIPFDRWALNLPSLGNTAGPSVLIALLDLLNNGSLEPGQTVLLLAFGAGLTWAGAVLQWQ